MKRNVKKVVSVVVASSLALSLAACSGGKDKEAVVDAADSFASNLVKMDAKKIFGATNIEDEDDQADLEELFTYDDDVRSAIADALSYEIDEDSVEVSKKDGEASVDVKFIMPDFEAVFDDTEASDESELIDELEDADTTEVKVTIEFELDDEDWVVVNADKVINSVFGTIYDAEIPSFVDLSNVSYIWYHDSDSTETEGWYVNTTVVDADINGLDDYSNVHYTVSLNGDVLYTSDNGTYEGYWREDLGADVNDNGYIVEGDYEITFYVGSVALDPVVAHVSIDETAGTFTAADFEANWYWEDEQVGNDAYYNNTDELDMDLRYIGNGEWNYYYDDIFYTVELDGQLLYTSETGTYEGYWTASRGAEMVDGCVAAGEYVITFYQGSTVLCQGTAYVSNDSTGTGTVTPSNPGVFTDVLAEVDSSFAAGLVDCCWFDPDNGYFMDTFMYDSGVSYVSYSIEVPTGTTDSVYYAFYYTDDADADFDAVLAGDPIYSATITPTAYTDGTFYDIDCNSGADGFYIVVVAADADSASNAPYLTSLCAVGEI